MSATNVGTDHRIDRARITALIPHQGAMCLWDEVLDWDAGAIRLRTAGHRASDNPLRSGGGLRAVHLCEYGAHAKAVHGGLLASAAGGAACNSTLRASTGLQGTWCARRSAWSRPTAASSTASASVTTRYCWPKVARRSCCNRPRPRSTGDRSRRQCGNPDPETARCPHHPAHHAVPS